MINWMQKHKKYLIPTIWISTIAFVGAGFVGWGSYDFNKDRSTSVAKVGDTPIKRAEFIQRYNNLYSYYASISENFSKEVAEANHLDQIALADLIQETMLINFAKDLGIGVNKDEVAKYIVEMQNFQIDGKFSREIYDNTMRQIGIKNKDFEDSIARVIMLDKLDKVLNTGVSKEDLELFSASLFMQDRLSVQTIKIDDNQSINFGEDELKKFWEENKNSYQTKKTYELSIEQIPLKSVEYTDDDLLEFYNTNRNLYIDSTTDEILTFEASKEKVIKDYQIDKNRNFALEEYLALKNNKKSFDDNITVAFDDSSFPFSEIQNAKISEVIKPFIYDNQYAVVKINKINEPKAMDYESAKELAIIDFEMKSKRDRLSNLAKNTLAKDFNGTDIGFVARDSLISIDGIADGNIPYILNEIFSRPTKDGFILLDENSAVLYKITDQKLLNPQKQDEYASMLSQNIQTLKKQELEQNLMSNLQKRYTIQSYYKGNSDE
ncbi:MAG: peptidylprolyl isomerase [Campylobacter sp.]|nr:peptidylprolyl isomerase [Campylobacter sp.]